MTTWSWLSFWLGVGCGVFVGGLIFTLGVLVKVARDDAKTIKQRPTGFNGGVD